MGRDGIPDRWIPYNAKGEVVEGTRFISFKVPLKLKVQKAVNIKWDVDTLLQSIPNIGLVIDLTNTARYYSPEDITSQGIQYRKIFCPGRELPPEEIVQIFFQTVDEFVNVNEDKLIGVHCTHGLNRTGYFVCRYMRDKMGIPADTAITSFEVARGYKIERANFLADLKGETPLQSDLSRRTMLIPVKTKMPSMEYFADKSARDVISARVFESNPRTHTAARSSGAVSYGSNGFAGNSRYRLVNRPYTSKSRTEDRLPSGNNYESWNQPSSYNNRYNTTRRDCVGTDQDVYRNHRTTSYYSNNESNRNNKQTSRYVSSNSYGSNADNSNYGSNRQYVRSCNQQDNYSQRRNRSSFWNKDDNS